MSDRPATLDRTTNAAIFRIAAKRLETGETACGCCKAISDAGGFGYEGFHAGLMKRYFHEGMIGGWGPYGDDDNGPRIIALCLMAAMVEAGDV